MVRLVLCVLALLVVPGLSDPVRTNVTQEAADPVFLQRQLDLMLLYFHLHEPNHLESCKNISNTWSIEKNIELFSNETAVTTFIEMLKHKWLLPRAVPFSILETEHTFEAVTLYNVLNSAKDYDTFYKTAVYVRDRVNENLFAYVLSVVILNRPDTQGIYIPRLFEVFPSYFNNGEIMTTAQRINTHGYRMIESYPSTYKWDENVVIRWNATIWSYYNSQNAPVSYFTHDYGLNAFYYNVHLSQPSWLHSEALPINKHRRGEWFLFLHKQLVTRYYMERLSNGLGEIPELGHEIVKEGYNSGLLYHNGVAFPVRPNYFHLNQPELVDAIEEIYEYERRVRDAIDQGYVLNDLGEHIDIRAPEAIEILGRVIESNVDSPNAQYYKDFISIWKKVLGNSLVRENGNSHHFIPLVVPSVLEHYQTALRDPAFYMIWKRVLGMLQLWQEKLPPYKREELALPEVTIQSIEVYGHRNTIYSNTLVTFFESTYVNVSTHLHMNEKEAQEVNDQVSVLVEHPRLNHKPFKVLLRVKSEVAKTVLIKFFLGPKFDSRGNKIPLHVNTQNFMQLDEFVYNLPKGTRRLARRYGTGGNSSTAIEVHDAIEKAMQGKGQYFKQTEGFVIPTQHLLIPKGRVGAFVGGMPFVLMVHISEYRAPKVANDATFDPTVLPGVSAIPPQLTDAPFGFPVDRPLYPWQIEGLKNLYFQNIKILHEPNPEMKVPYTE